MYVSIIYTYVYIYTDVGAEHWGTWYVVGMILGFPADLDG